jgi:hypothetical protein
MNITGYLNRITFEFYYGFTVCPFLVFFPGLVIREHLRILVCFIVSMCFESSILHRVVTLPRFFSNIYPTVLVSSGI